MNKVILLGNLGGDPEMFTADSGTKFCKLSIATDGWSEDKQPDWHNVICFQKVAENVVSFLKKGDQVLLDGRIQNNRYENDEGKTVYGYQIVANSVEFLRKRKDGEEPAPRRSAERI